MPRTTKAQLDRLRAIESELTALSSSSDALKREAKQIIDAATADLRESKKPKITRGGYTLMWQESKCSVSWKSEFVRVAGSAAAKKISAEVPKKKKLEIVDPPAVVPVAEE